MQVLLYAGPFAFLMALPLSYMLSPFGPYLVPLILFLTLLAGSYVPEPILSGKDWVLARLLPIIYIPCQLTVIGWGIWEVTDPEVTWQAFLGLALSTGVCSGVFGVLAAHELIHSRVRWHRTLALLMLTGISYRHFRLAHLYGHHRLAVTKHDPSTARLDESCYAFFARTLLAQAACAWRFEKSRLRCRKLNPLYNRLVHDILIAAALYVILWLGPGSAATAFLGLESFVAIVVLELFNYVAHYGLERRGDEAMGDRHSWNSSGAANLLLFNMGRHGEHHHAPASGYFTLQPSRSGPDLPGGYAGAILLALVPLLWRKVIHPRLNALACESRYGGGVVLAAAAP